MNEELNKLLKYKGVIFDLDGTLVNSMPLHIKAWQKTVSKYGIILDEAWLYAHGGVPSKTIAKMIIERFNLKDLTPEYIAKIKTQNYLETINEVQVYPKMLKVLEFLKEHNIPMAIGTGTLRSNALIILENTPLKNYISHIVSADDVEKHKPDPETFLVAAKLINVEPKDAVVFEDTPLGIECAKRGNFSTIFVKDGIPKIL